MGQALKAHPQFTTPSTSSSLQHYCRQSLTLPSPESGRASSIRSYPFNPSAQLMSGVMIWPFKVFFDGVGRKLDSNGASERTGTTTHPGSLLRAPEGNQSSSAARVSQARSQTHRGRHQTFHFPRYLPSVPALLAVSASSTFADPNSSTALRTVSYHSYDLPVWLRRKSSYSLASAGSLNGCGSRRASAATADGRKPKDVGTQSVGWKVGDAEARGSKIRMLGLETYIRHEHVEKGRLKDWRTRGSGVRTARRRSSSCDCRLLLTNSGQRAS